MAVTAEPGKSLKRLSIEGAAWTTASFGLGQLLRLASNLAMTRLLAPEDFGLMALVTVFMIGMSMFSDLGIGPNIIQSPRNREDSFLNAAWTLEVARGTVLWVVCALAALPAAQFYELPQLAWLIPVAGIAAIIQGFNSTNIQTAYRDLRVGRVAMLELFAQIVAVAGMIALASVWRSVWVLVAGSLIGALVKMLGSHVWLPGIRNRLHWDWPAMVGLLHFGKWIFLSTLFAFGANSSASLILGKFVSSADLGLFSIAATLAKAVEQVYQQIASRVLLPVYAQIRSAPIDQLRNKVRQIRLGIMAMFLPALVVLAVFGDELVRLLFDSRYEGAGWILRVFAIGLLPPIVSGIGPFYLALGNARLTMYVSAIKLVAFLGAAIAGWQVAGSTGLIVGMACSTFAVYLADAAIQARHRIWLPRLDLAGYGSAFAAIIGLSWLQGR